MRKSLIPIAMMALFVAAPSAAHDYGDGSGQIERRLDRLEERLANAADRRLISGRDEERFERRIEAIDDLLDRYSRNGLSHWELDDLFYRTDALERDIIARTRYRNDWRSDGWGRSWDRSYGRSWDGGDDRDYDDDDDDEDDD